MCLMKIAQMSKLVGKCMSVPYLASQWVVETLDKADDARPAFEQMNTFEQD